MTPDGNIVAFDSDSGRLTPSDVNQLSDVFVRDVRKDRIELVSKTPEGLPAVGDPDVLFGVPGSFYLASTGLSVDPDVSTSGRFVAYASRAINLVPGDTNLAWDVFVYDRKNQTTKRVSVAPDGSDSRPPVGGHGSYRPSISGNGRFVSFSSNATNLVEGDPNGLESPQGLRNDDVYVYDRLKEEMSRATVGPSGEEARVVSRNLLPFYPASSLSPSGKYVIFSSSASNLVSNDTNMIPDVFIRDIQSETTKRVSLASDGSQALDPRYQTRLTSDGWEGSLLTGGESFWAVGESSSKNGRYVVFTSQAVNLVPHDTNGGQEPQHGTDVFVHDRKTGRTERVTVEPDGRQINTSATIFGWGWPTTPTISPDGRFVAYTCNECVGAGPQSVYPPGHTADGSDFGDDNTVVFDRKTGSVFIMP